MEYRALGRTGLQLSAVGFGAGPLGGEYGPLDVSECERAVHSAIDYGINFFDTAPYYGRTLSESRLGAALRGRREKVILCTKLGRYEKAGFDFSAARVRTSIDESLTRLQTDHVDMLIAHDIEFTDREQIIAETIPAMRDLQREGKARFIGISGLPLKILSDVADRGRVDFVLSYCRYTLLNRDLDQWLAPVLRKNNIGLIGAAPTHMGILTQAGAPEWHPAQPEIKQAGGRIVDLCREAGVEPACLAVWFTMQNPLIASTLVGISRPSELNANLKALELTPDPRLLTEIEAIYNDLTERIWPSGRPENDD